MGVAMVFTYSQRSLLISRLEFRRWRPLDVTGYALGLTVAARQNGA